LKSLEYARAIYIRISTNSKQDGPSRKKEKVAPFKGYNSAEFPTTDIKKTPYRGNQTAPLLDKMTMNMKQVKKIMRCRAVYLSL
jgi:hypothetical protein